MIMPWRVHHSITFTRFSSARQKVAVILLRFFPTGHASTRASGNTTMRLREATAAHPSFQPRMHRIRAQGVSLEPF